MNSLICLLTAGYQQSNREGVICVFSFFSLVLALWPCPIVSCFGICLGVMLPGAAMTVIPAVTGAAITMSVKRKEQALNRACPYSPVTSLLFFSYPMQG